MYLSSIVLVLNLINFTTGILLEFYIASDTSCWIVGPTSTGSKAIIHSTSSSWKTVIQNANWIWDIQGNTEIGVAFVTKHFYIAGTVISGSLQISADDAFTTYINDKDAGCTEVGSFSTTSGITCDVSSFLTTELNKLAIKVVNSGKAGAVIFKLTVFSNY